MSMVWIRTSSGVSITGTLPWFCTALRTSRTPCGARPNRLSGSRFGLAGSLLCVGAHDLCDAQGKGTPLLDTHQRQGEKGQPGYRLAVETRKKPIQPMGVFARWWPPLHHPPPGRRPRDDTHADERRPKTGWPTGSPSQKSVAPSDNCPRCRPTGRRPNIVTSRHDHHGQRNAVELTQCGRCDGRVEALQTGYHVHRGLPCGFGLSLWQTTTL